MAHVNSVAFTLWDVMLRKGGAASKDFGRSEGGRPNEKPVHDARVSDPSAAELGYNTRQQRQRWETCAELPDVKAKLARDTINSVAFTLWDVMRKGGAASAMFERRPAVIRQPYMM